MYAFAEFVVFPSNSLVFVWIVNPCRMFVRVRQFKVENIFMGLCGINEYLNKRVLGALHVKSSLLLKP